MARRSSVPRALLAAALLALVVLSSVMFVPPALAEEEEESAVLALTSETYADAVGASKFHFVKFFAPWCGHCKKLEPTWGELAAAMKEKDVEIATVDCTVYKEICQENGVKGYPTLKMFFKGEEVETYKGARSMDALSSFVNGKLASM